MGGVLVCPLGRIEISGQLRPEAAGASRFWPPAGYTYGRVRLSAHRDGICDRICVVLRRGFTTGSAGSLLDCKHGSPACPHRLMLQAAASE